MGLLTRLAKFAPPMRHLWFLVLLCATAAVPAVAQRHSLGTSPPTAPPMNRFAPGLTPTSGTAGSAAGTGPVAPVSSGLGAIQFVPANTGVPAPQALTRQLSSDDERTRSGALASLGAPGQYLSRGHVPYPHSVQLDLAQLGESDQIDALLTVELDQHIVTAVLVPDGESWRRVATVSFASVFSNAATAPATFARALRSWLQPDRYRAVFHATVGTPSGDFTENEADLHIVNNRAVVVLDFVSGSRQCDTGGPLHTAHQGCELLQRWLEPDPADPKHHFSLITAVGHFSAREADDPLSRSRNYRLTRLHSFTCQPFVFSGQAMRFQPVANATPCYVHDPGTAQHTAAEHPDRADHPDHAEHSDHPDHVERPDHVDHTEAGHSS